jgi:hypothetical protein
MRLNKFIDAHPILSLLGVWLGFVLWIVLLKLCIMRFLP